jgi:hypothetical protein
VCGERWVPVPDAGNCSLRRKPVATAGPDRNFGSDIDAKPPV